MISYVLYFLTNLSNYLVAPLYFHFGHTWLFIEICVLFNSVTDTTVLFFIVFIFVLCVSFYRNYVFQIFTTNLFKNYTTYFNYLPLLTYFSNFFTSFSKTVTFLSNKFSSFFKNRK